MSRRAQSTDASEIRAEIDAHIDARVRDNLARGMSMDDAEREARQRFGPVEAVERESARARGGLTHAVRRLGSDLGHAWRAARRRPFALVTGVLVVAIGLTTSLSATRVADAVAFRTPAGVGRPYELASILGGTDGRPGGGLMSYAVVRRISLDVPESEMFAWDRRDLQVIDGASARVWPGEVVTGSYFGALRVQAAAGRLFGPSDDEQHAPVVVVSWRMAAALRNRPPDLVGASLRVNGRVFNVVGVAAKGFQGLESGFPSDVFLPMSSEPDISTPRVFPDGTKVRGFAGNPSVGWLRGGARFPTAEIRDRLAPRMSAALRAATPRPEQGQRVAIAETPWNLQGWWGQVQLSAILAPIAWAVGFTLLLASVCLGSACVGRLSDREREFAVRLALGATRGRLARLALLELALVVLIGSAVAAAGSQAVLALAGGFELAPSVRLEDAVTRGFDLRAGATLALMSAIVCLVASIGPASVLRRMNRQIRIESNRVTRAGARWRRTLLACQVGVACALLSGAVLLTRSIDALRAQPLGFNASAVFAMLDPAGAGLSDGERAALIDRLTERTWPAGASVAFADQVPFSSKDGHPDTLFVKGTHSETRRYPVFFSRVSPEYLDTIGIPLIAGRDFSRADQTRHVAIVNEHLAQTYWPGRPAVGESILVGGERGVPYEVIGVVAATRDVWLKYDDLSRLYLPYSTDAESLTLVATLPAGASADALFGAVVRELDPRLVVIQTGSLRSLAWRSIEQRLMLRFVTMTIGIGSLLMVTVGVWGLAESTLRRRWKEFGVRQALGASRRSIVRLALSDGFIVALAGGLVGVAGAWQIGRVLKAFLFGVGSNNPAAIAAGVLLVGAAALAGSIVPANRASKIDAAELLRDDQ